MRGASPGPKHNWKTTHKSRQDADADIVEESYVERSIYVFALATVAACIAGWWWRDSLEGWPRGIVLAATILVTRGCPEFRGTSVAVR